MSLYLCVFVSGAEAEGIDAGSYSDFNRLRHYIVGALEDGKTGARFPNLILHSDCDGVWSPKDCTGLRDELAQIIDFMRERPAERFPPGWQDALARMLRLEPRNALESFIDVDGAPLLLRLLDLVEIALSAGEPILFQ
ncbi:MAG: Imm70 family immunity protein [Opitutaceae bacterium]|jgi:hypothetical protein